MATFLYAPGVRVNISTEHHGVIDVSDDLVDGAMQRRSDGVSTFNCSIQNTQRKYDGVFTPNDRITVEMKRVTWVRTFTGYLNSVPLLTAWPTVVALAASCSLKRLQYWYWDPNLSAVANQVGQAVTAGRGTADAGITNGILTIMKGVVGWPEQKVHIGAIPGNWFNLMMPYITELHKELANTDAATLAWLNLVGTGTVGGTAVGGGGTSGTSVVSSGKLAKVGVDQWNSRQLNNAEVICQVGANMGIAPKYIVAAVSTAICETGLYESDTPPHPGGKVVDGDHDSVGLFQQREMYYGHGNHDQTVAWLSDPSNAATNFFNQVLKTLAKQPNKDPAILCMGIQRPNGPYTPITLQGRIPQGQAIYNAWAVATGGSPTGGMSTDGNTAAAITGGTAGAGATNGTVATSVGLPSSDVFLQAGLSIVDKWPNMRYGSLQNQNDIKSKTKQPATIGCSGLMSMALFWAIGRIPSGWPIEESGGQYEWCVKNGGQDLSIIEASKTKGALLFRRDSALLGHVAMSVGDGKTMVEAANGNANTHPQVGIRPFYNGFTNACTMPLFDYSNAKNGIAPQVTGTAGTGVANAAASSTYQTAAQSPGYNPNSAIDKLFGGQLVVDNLVNNADTALAQALVGPRALMNDQPLLPYIMNMIHASMRSFCSAPNGDLMAWFPDYYGLWGSAAKMVIEPIELQDFYVEWSDDALVTHQFTSAGTVNHYDVFSGGIQTTYGGDAFEQGDLRVTTIGIATIDIPAIMYSLFGVAMNRADGTKFADWVYKKFGARPDYQQVDGLQGKSAELFSALYFFMRQWAYQYNANIPVTFMPELWPGMLVQIPEYDFQAYVTAVTHNFRFGQGGSFTTTINVAAPARMPNGSGDTGNVLIGLPTASPYGVPPVIQPVPADPLAAVTLAVPLAVKKFGTRAF